MFHVGSIVWYLDCSGFGIPKIRKGVVQKEYLDWDTPNYYTLEGKEGKYYYDQLFPTKEALLAAIDPPEHNFKVGQEVWEVCNDYADNVMHFEKGTVVSTTSDSVELLQGGIFSVIKTSEPRFSMLFDNPQDAVNKALELK